MNGRIARRLAPAAAALAVVAAATTSPAQAAPGFTVKTLHITVVAGADDDMRCDVVADLYRPDGVDAAHPAPALLMTNGFGGSKDDQAKQARGFAGRGYVVLSYSGIGFGGSGCPISLDDRDVDGKAGSQLVTFLGGGKAADDGTVVDYVTHDATAHDGVHHDADPRVGMLGGSYGGQVQFAVAAVDPRVDTIVPMITWNDLSYSLAPNDTSQVLGVSSQTPGAMKLVWTFGFFALGAQAGIDHLQTDPGRLLPCPNFDDRACAAAAQMLALGAPNSATTAFARHASVASYTGDVRIPTLLVQGEDDSLFNLQESVATYRALRAQGTPVKLVWQLGGHSGPNAPGETDLSFARPSYQGAMIADWFDHYLKDDARAPSLDFTFFRDWVRYDGDATPAYGRAPAYPVAARTTDFHLSGTSALRPDGEPVQKGTATLLTTAVGLPTSYTEISAVDPGSRPLDLPGTSAAWTSAPLADDTDVIGVPTVDLRVSAPLQTLTGAVAGAPGGLVFFVRLEDVAPDGSVTLPHKLVSPVRVADPTVPVHIELPGIVHRFGKGHRLRLVVYGGDLAYRAGNVPGPMSVMTDAARPGTLRLPVAPEDTYGSVVRAAAPAAARTCRRRTVTVHLARRWRAKVRSARVVAGGRTVGRLRGRGGVRVRLTGTKVTRIRIVMRLKDGRTRTDVRSLRACPKTRR